MFPIKRQDSSVLYGRKLQNIIIGELLICLAPLLKRDHVVAKLPQERPGRPLLIHLCLNGGSQWVMRLGGAGPWRSIRLTVYAPQVQKSI